MSTAGSAGSAASRGEAARARTERAHELRRNSRESRSTRTAEPEPEDGDTLPAELTQTTTRAEHASRGARRHAESLSETVTLLRDAQLLPAEAICEMIADDTADGGHRGADANTDYVGPQEGEVLTAAALAVAV